MFRSVLLSASIMLCGCEALTDRVGDVFDATLSRPHRWCQAYVFAGWKGYVGTCIDMYYDDYIACFADEGTSYYCKLDSDKARVKLYDIFYLNVDGEPVFVKEVDLSAIQNIETGSIDEI